MDEPAGSAAQDPADQRALLAAQAASQRAFYRALAGGSPGARLATWAAVQATIVPVRPWFSIFNGVFYEDPEALTHALPAVADAYKGAGVKAWRVWRPPHLPEVTFSEAAAFSATEGPLLMAAPIGDLDLEPRVRLELEPDPTWEMVARCNDRAHGVLEEWSMAAVVATMSDPATRLYAARHDDQTACCLLVRQHEGDCYFWFVATVPEAQGRGLASELMRHALRDARDAGCATTTLESTRAGEHVYERVGLRPLGRYTVYEHQDV